jgi:hypothetical protein
VVDCGAGKEVLAIGAAGKEVDEAVAALVAFDVEISEVVLIAMAEE